MNKRSHIVIFLLLLLGCAATAYAQQRPAPAREKRVYLTSMCIYQGDTIPVTRSIDIEGERKKALEGVAVFLYYFNN